MSVVMAWYGVNFVLGVGLHAYGFTKGGGQGIVSSVCLALIAFPVAAGWRRYLGSRLVTHDAFVPGSIRNVNRNDLIALGTLRGIDRLGIACQPGGDPLPFSHVEAVLRSPGRFVDRLEKVRCAAGMDMDSMCLPLASLHTSRGELDEGLEHVGHGSSAPVGVPQQLPDLVGLPVIARVEERDPSKIDGGLPPSIGDYRRRGTFGATVRMPVG